MRLTAVTRSDPDGGRLSALMTHSVIGSYSSSLREMLCSLYAAARFPLSLNTLYHSLEDHKLKIFSLYFDVYIIYFIQFHTLAFLPLDVIIYNKQHCYILIVPLNVLKPGQHCQYREWLQAGWARGRSSSPSRVKNFLFSMLSRLAPRSTQPCIQWAPEAFSPGVKKPGSEADHSPPGSAEVNKMLIYTFVPPYAFMA
jgi:hypothetical protein